MINQVLANPTLFNGFVGSVLKRLCDKEGKQLLSHKEIDIDSESRFDADYMLVEGCEALGLENKTIVEVKFRLTENSYNQFRTIVDDTQLELLVITLESFDVPLSPIVNGLQGRKIKFRSIWDLLEIIRSNNISLSSLIEVSNRENLAKDDRGDIYKSLCNYPFEFNKKIIDEATNRFNVNRVTLFLGAGVSSSAKLPEWTTLLQNILSDDSQLPLKFEDYPAIDKASFNSPIITARHILWPYERSLSPDGYSGSKVDLVQILSKALYKNYKNTESQLIKTIVEICKSTDKEGKPVPREGMSIITFNYDDLIEIELDKQGIAFQEIHGENICKKGHLPVIHVHGVLHQKKPNVTMPVLSEREYHKLYKGVFHWSNVEIELALYRTSCFFIGLSMQDPNLRRLLEFVALENNNNIPHFAILPMQTLDSLNKQASKSKDSSSTDSSSADSYKKDFYKKDSFKNTEFVQRQEDVFRQLGVNVIWYPEGEYDYVPMILKRIAGIES